MDIEIIIRRIKRNQKWFGLNTLGLSIAFACTIMVYSFVRNELSYDTFHSKADRICRITQNTNTGKSSTIDARVWTGLAPG
jgi:putative ABC transport system permease protein